MEYQDLGHILGVQGINTDFLEEKLPNPDSPIYLTSANNVLVRNGKVEKLRGTDYLNSISTQLGADNYRTIVGAAIFRKDDGTKYMMIGTPLDLYYLKTNDTWEDIGNISAGGNDSAMTSATLLDSFVFTLSDSGIIYSWDGTTYGPLFTAPDDANRKARYLLGFKTYLFLLRPILTVDSVTTEYHRRIMWSWPGQITKFDDTDILDIDAEGVIMGGKRLEDAWIVYLDRSVHRVYWAGETDMFLSEPISDGAGLIAHKSLCGNKDVHFYLSSDGFMRLLRGDVPRPVSDRKFNKLVLDQIDPVYYHRAVAQFYPQLNLVYLAYPKSGSAYNDTQVIYDNVAEELVSIKALPENYSAYGVFEKDLSSLAPDERRAYGLSFIPIMGTKDGYVKEQKVIGYQDGVGNYETSMEFPTVFWKDPSRNKRCMQVDLMIEKLTDAPITFILSLANEANANWTFQYTISGTGNQGVRRYEFNYDDSGLGVDCLGKEFKVQIKDSNNPYGWKFHGAIFRGYIAGQK